MKRLISFGYFSFFLYLRDELIYFNYISIDNIGDARTGGGRMEERHETGEGARLKQYVIIKLLEWKFNNIVFGILILVNRIYLPNQFDVIYSVPDLSIIPMYVFKASNRILMIRLVSLGFERLANTHTKRS